MYLNLRDFTKTRGFSDADLGRSASVRVIVGDVGLLNLFGNRGRSLLKRLSHAQFILGTVRPAGRVGPILLKLCRIRMQNRRHRIASSHLPRLKAPSVTCIMFSCKLGGRAAAFP